MSEGVNGNGNGNGDLLKVWVLHCLGHCLMWFEYFLILLWIE